MSTAALLPPAPGARLDAAVAGAHRVVDELLSLLATDADAVARDAAGQRESLREVERLGRRLESVRLRMIAKAESARVPERTGFTDTGAWVSRHTQVNAREAAGAAVLAKGLGEESASDSVARAWREGDDEASRQVGSGRSATGQALDRGEVSAAHAKVILATLAELPDGLDAAGRAACEAELLRLAANRTPARLRLLARRVLAAAGRDAAEVDAHEDRVVTAEEDRAWQAASFWLRDNSDGTMSGAFTVPWVAGATLRKVLDAMTAPRRRGDAESPAPGRGATSRSADWKGEQVDWQHRRGVAFAELLQRVPTDHLHGKVAATLVVSTDLDTLRGDLERVGHSDLSGSVSAGEVRRAACGGGLLPVVMGGASLPLDLGRQERCFTEAQRVALGAVYDSCAADGCDRPYAWCELHHLTAWVAGGRTDLVNAVPLCGEHHRWVDRSDSGHLVSRVDGRIRIRFRRRVEG